jgi:hypothetical protein
MIVTHRPKYARRAREQAVVQASAPEQLIKGGLSTEAMVAYILWLPNTPGICRSIGKRKCCSRKASTSSARSWRSGSGYAAAELKPLYLRLQELILGSSTLAVDETVVPVLDPGRGCEAGRVKKALLVGARAASARFRSAAHRLFLR